MTERWGDGGMQNLWGSSFGRDVRPIGDKHVIAVTDRRGIDECARSPVQDTWQIKMFRG